MAIPALKAAMTGIAAAIILQAGAALAEPEATPATPPKTEAERMEAAEMAGQNEATTLEQNTKTPDTQVAGDNVENTVEQKGERSEETEEPAPVESAKPTESVVAEEAAAEPDSQTAEAEPGEESFIDVPPEPNVPDKVTVPEMEMEPEKAAITEPVEVGEEDNKGKAIEVKAEKEETQDDTTVQPRKSKRWWGRPY